MNPIGFMSANMMASAANSEGICIRVFNTIDNSQENNKETSPSHVLTWIQFFYTSDELLQIIKSNAVIEDNRFIYIEPSICVELKFLDWYKDEIRQPRFSKFRLDLTWEACTWEEARTHSLKSR